MWIAFGQGKHLRWIPIHDLKKTNLGDFLFTFTGCDVVSAFHGKGKNSARRNLSKRDICVGQSIQVNQSVTGDTLQRLEKIIVAMYGK